METAAILNSDAFVCHPPTKARLSRHSKLYAATFETSLPHL
jgi:hypothetical protein